MRKIVCVLIAISTIVPLALVFACDSDSEAEVTWKLASYVQEGDVRTDTLYKFAELVEEKTDGRMEIKVFPGDTLYPVMECFDAVSGGNCEAAYLPLAYIIGKMPFTGLDMMVMLETGIDENIQFQKKVSELPQVQQELDQNNMMVMLWLNIGYMEWFFTDSVDTLDDLEGMSLRSFGGFCDAWIELLGAAPVSVPAAEQYLSAETKMIDGSLGTVYDYERMKLYEVMPNLVISEVLTVNNPLFFHAPSFNDLPEDLKEAVLEAQSEAEQWGLEQSSSEISTLMQSLIDNPDVDVEYFSDSDCTRLYDEVYIPVMQSIIVGQLGAEMWETLVGISEDI